MGMIVDTNVFIHFEKSGKAIDLSPWESSEKAYISVVTVSELLIGVHRANTEERKQLRSAFVETVISKIGVLDFTIDCARIHAEIYTELAKKGQLIGAHDLIIAATARYHDLSMLTDNVEEFSRVPHLHVIPFVS
ncbi:MAG TPA: type II toxin-antitoxin system VapC family toxin [Gemmataceae bacterium]|nr:type II toxin-antitoxin system VapC family toxin [Gemmataceae bacterium]